MRLDHHSLDLGYHSSEDCRMRQHQQRRQASHTRATTLNTSGCYNQTSLAHTALHASSQSLDHYPVNPHYPNSTPPSYPRSPVHHQRYNQYAPPAAPSPPPTGYYSPSPKRSGAANFYWTARVGWLFDQLDQNLARVIQKIISDRSNSNFWTFSNQQRQTISLSVLLSRHVRLKMFMYSMWPLQLL